MTTFARGRLKRVEPARRRRSRGTKCSGATARSWPCPTLADQHPSPRGGCVLEGGSWQCPRPPRASPQPELPSPGGRGVVAQHDVSAGIPIPGNAEVVPVENVVDRGQGKPTAVGDGDREGCLLAEKVRVVDDGGESVQCQRPVDRLLEQAETGVDAVHNGEAIEHARVIE